jgi:hypothetical protein
MGLSGLLLNRVIGMIVFIFTFVGVAVVGVSRASSVFGDMHAQW